METTPASEALLLENNVTLMWKATDGNKQLRQTKNLQQSEGQNIY